MNAQERERVVVSVGGSLIVPDQIDVHFLSALRAFVLDQIGRGFSFAIVTGGGKTARRYMAAGKEVAQLAKEETDWIGISVNCMHAEFLRIIFGEHAAPDIVKDFKKPVPTKHPVILVGAEKPGHSSDVDAVIVARLLDAKRVVNLSNIDYVYDKDPRTNPDARKIEKISWAEFRRIIPDHWDPGLSSPFDPIAAKEAEQLGLEVAIMNGSKLNEFSSYLGNKTFVGTIIS